MDRGSDPTHVRLGINLGASEDGITTAKLMNTLNEVLSRVLNLARLGMLAAPILLQVFYIHSVDFVSWLLRLLLVYALIGGICFVAVPDSLYNGLGLGMFRWLFERVYPEIAKSNGSLADVTELRPAPTLGRLRVNELGGKRVMLRWLRNRRFLCLTQEGWAVTGEQSLAATLLVQPFYVKEKQVPDTYTFRVVDPTSDWHQAWLAFQPVNHWHFGGWLGAYRDAKRACPYKVIHDSSCAPGTCKLLCACTAAPGPTQRSVTGFYLAEQICRSELYVGYAADRDAALLEFVIVE